MCVKTFVTGVRGNKPSMAKLAEVVSHEVLNGLMHWRSPVLKNTTNESWTQSSRLLKPGIRVKRGRHE